MPCSKWSKLGDSPSPGDKDEVSTSQHKQTEVEKIGNSSAGGGGEQIRVLLSEEEEIIQKQI